MWNGYIEQSLQDDLGFNMAKVYLDPPRSEFFVAVRDGDVLGIVGAEAKDEDEIELRRMSVAAAARGLGLGSQLVARVEEHAREHSFARVMLSTGNNMDLALGLYRSCGYVETPEGKKWDEDSEGDDGGVVFIKEIWPKTGAKL